MASELSIASPSDKSKVDPVMEIENQMAGINAAMKKQQAEKRKDAKTTQRNDVRTTPMKRPAGCELISTPQKKPANGTEAAPVNAKYQLLLRSCPRYLQGDHRKSRNAFLSKAYNDAKKEAKSAGHSGKQLDSFARQAWASASVVFDAAWCN